MMDTEPNLHFDQDKQAVQAVRGGDAERYRELVERHERRVFAVAWSRLGDAALAEEVAQEAFIRAYRKLWLLGDGAKSSAWIAAITRRVAINCGLRNRRELNKRQRWALEQTAASADEPAELCPPETLRQALAGLPAAHRECLVLFYLESKSGAEAAAALGISESALRVRLHRARAALREQLEERLGQSLQQLRPPRPLSSAVMGTILSSSSAKMAGGAGIGAKVLVWLLPFKLFAGFFWAIGVLPMLPGVFFSLRTIRMQQTNYRDPSGFRARLHRDWYSRRLWPVVLLLVLFQALFFGLVIPYTLPIFGIKTIYLAIAALLLPVCYFSARRLAISSNRYLVATLVSCLMLMAGLVAIGLGLLPQTAFLMVIMCYMLPVVIGYGARPLRMDYNLFLRASQELLEVTPAESGLAEAALQLSKSQLRAFARFLGNRWLVVGHHWQGRRLVLRVPAIKATFLNSLYAAFGNRASSLRLEVNGSVEARLGAKDEQDLLALHGRDLPGAADLENRVAAAVQSAWWHFRNGDSATAERAVGQVPDAEVFLVPTARSKATLWLCIILGGASVVGGILMGSLWLFPERFSDLKPVSVTEAEVRAFLENIHTNPNPVLIGTQSFYTGDALTALYSCLVLPPTNLFSPGGLQAARQEAIRASGLNSQGEKQLKILTLDSYPLLDKAMAGGWVNWNDVGLNPQDVTIYFHQHIKTNGWNFTLSVEKAWSWVDNKGWDVERINDLTLNKLRWLRDVDCLDLIDRAKLIRQISSVQDLSASVPPGQPPLHDWRDVRGLFFTPCWPALQDTYFSLATLEILGGLDKIDREECIRGILRRHHGKGFFDSPSSGSYNEYHIDGSARDTFAAFESLRILGALDRVKDLDKWQFRLASYRLPKPDPNGSRPLTWDDIEAWVCQQRLARDLAEHKQTPAAPWQSLLYP